MGNANVPSEYHGCRCSVCNRALPACKNWSDFFEEDVDRLVDRRHVFNFKHGTYYRFPGPLIYYCADCFWKPKWDELNRRRRQAEEQRKREAAAAEAEERERRRRREADERRRAKARADAEERRKEEVRREAKRLKALQEQREREAKERKRKEEAQQNFEEKLSKGKSPSRQYFAWTLQQEREKSRQSVLVQPYQSERFIDGSLSEVKESTEALEVLWESPQHIEDTLPEGFSVLFLDEDDSGDELEAEDTTLHEASYAHSANTADLLRIVPIMEPSCFLAGNRQWLGAVQTQLLLHYTGDKSHGLEFDIMMEALSSMNTSLSDQEMFKLTQVLCSVCAYQTQYDHPPSNVVDKLCGELVERAVGLGFEKSECTSKCLQMLISVRLQDEELQHMLTETFTTSLWSIRDVRFFMQEVSQKVYPIIQKVILHLAQTYQVPSFAVEEAMKSSYAVDSLKTYISTRPEKGLREIIDEIANTKLVEEGMLKTVESIVDYVVSQLFHPDIFLMEADYMKYLTDSTLKESDMYLVLSDSKLYYMKAALERASEGSRTLVKDVSLVLATLSCAVYSSTGGEYAPRKTQLVAVCILILSSISKNKDERVNQLLEVLTGEGKSCIIAMFAAALGVQGRQVDIVTSSPVLAWRDARDWARFYKIFHLNAADNTDFESERVTSSKEFDADALRRQWYSNPIVYGTVSSYSADILREEFEQKQVRSGRQFDVIITDEVDMLMLDEGVQFTYLSHRAAILRHLDPVIAIVWSVVGQHKAMPTTDGDILYGGAPNFFHNVIFESMDIDAIARECPELELHHSEQLLELAVQQGVVDLNTMQRFQSADDKEAKKQAMKSVQTKEVLNQLEKFLPCKFLLYSVNEDGLLKYNERISLHERTLPLPEVSILVSSHGVCCALYTQNELRSGVQEDVLSHIRFSGTPSSQTEEKTVEIPKFLRTYVKNQLPTYINSAFKALQMTENREYLIKRSEILPIDFENSGVVQINKRWGEGLQQMLEMKHNLKISSMSVVTNFMSHIEFFQRYVREGSVYGLSGTLGLDSDVEFLKNLYKVRVCGIPTYRQRNIYEREAVIVEGTRDKWLNHICSTIKEVISPRAWAKGRAALILCEDIRTANEMKKLIEKNKIGKVTPYTRNDTAQIKAIQKDREFKPGEIVIATNLAGRGTDIKVDSEVNDSGGLFCLITFLPRNKRVELQAFGRTGRSGSPGSVQFILPAASLPPEWQGHSIKDVRKIRAERENRRLCIMMDTDVKEVELREKLFRQHCEFLKYIHKQISQRVDKAVVIDAINENWGKWLQLKAHQIGQLEEKALVDSLMKAHQLWKPPQLVPHTEILYLPEASFYHLVKFGNQLLIEQEKKNAEKASLYFSKAIEMEPSYAAIAYYNRAYCRIIVRSKGYIDDCISDLTKAKQSLSHYTDEVNSVLQCVLVVNVTTQQPTAKDDQSHSPQARATALELEPAPDQEHSDDIEGNDFVTQMQVRLQTFHFFEKNIEEAVAKLEEFKKKGDDVEAVPVGVFSLIPHGDYITNMELYGLWHLGLEVVFSVKKKPKFCWKGLLVFLIGVAQIAVGVCLTVFSAGTASSIGMSLIAEGVSDCIEGAIGMYKGELDLKQWGIDKACSLAVSLVSGGVGKFVNKGFKGCKAGLKQLGRELRALPKVAKESWGTAAKANLKNVSKHVVKEVAQQGASVALDKLESKILEGVAQEIGKLIGAAAGRHLERSFSEGNLGRVVDRMFAQDLPPSYAADDKMSPGLEKRAIDFFTTVTDDTVTALTSHSAVYDKIESVCLKLDKKIAEKCKSKKTGLRFVEGMFALNDLTSTLVQETELITKFESEICDRCEKHCKAQNVPAYDRTDRRQHLQCVKTLKRTLAIKTKDAFSKAAGNIFHQNLSTIAKHGLSRTVNQAASNYIKGKLNMERTKEKIKAAEAANHIRSMKPTASEHSEHADLSVVRSHASTLRDPKTPGTLLELKVAVEHYGHGVTIVDHKGQQVCSISSPSTDSVKGKPNITLQYTPPDKVYQSGRYDVVVKGEVKNVSSMFEAYAAGLNAASSHAKAIRAPPLSDKSVRRAVATELKDQPHKWHAHISKKSVAEEIRGGRLFLLPDRSKMTRIVAPTYKDSLKDDKVTHLTQYEQLNGVKCQVTRKYDKRLQLEPVRTQRGHKVLNDDSKETSVQIQMTGLNFAKNEGHRWNAKPSTEQNAGMSFHLVPSQCGANTGIRYGNSVIASHHYNKGEMSPWAPKLREFTRDKDFECNVKVKFEPLVPRNMDAFVRDLNSMRTKEGRPPFPVHDKEKLRKRFSEIQRKYPRAQRVAEVKWEITNHRKEKQEFRMPHRDLELFVHPRFGGPNDISRSQRRYLNATLYSDST